MLNFSTKFTYITNRKEGLLIRNLLLFWNGRSLPVFLVVVESVTFFVHLKSTVLEESFMVRSLNFGPLIILSHIYVSLYGCFHDTLID